MITITERLDRALRAAGLAIDGVSIGAVTNRTTWTVSPPFLQAQAQPHIDSFNPDDPAHEQADLDARVKSALDTERLASAIVWAVLDTYSASATKAKYATARQKIIDAYKAQPWV